VFEFPHVVRVEEDFKAEGVKKKNLFSKKIFWDVLSATDWTGLARGRAHGPMCVAS
jgi:hypothetical protein